jgi:hypothetical protein
MGTVTSWTGAINSDWTNPGNWTAGVPTAGGAPVWPGEVAQISAGTAIDSDGTLDGVVVALNGPFATAPVFEFDVSGQSFGPGVVVANSSAGLGGVLETIGGFDNKGLILSDAAGGILQVDALTPSNALLRGLWTSEGLIRATNGGTVEIAQPVATQVQEGTSVPEFDYFQSNGTILADDGGTVQLNYETGSQGAIIASGGTIVVASGPGVNGIFQAYNALVTVPGAGVVYVGNGGVIDDAGGIGEPIYFTDTTGTLILRNAANGTLPLAGPIVGFRPGDTIELANHTITSAAYNYGTLGGQPGTITLQIDNGSAAVGLVVDGDYRNASFGVTADGHGLVVSTPVGTATTDTVPAAGGVSRSLAFGNASVAAIAAPLIAGIATAKTLFADAAGATTMSAAQTAAIVAATGATTIAGNAAANETIAAGSGAFAFAGGTGSGTVLAGGGADSVYLPGGGNWLARLGNGADTVVAATGNDTIGTGTGGSFVFLGAGADSVSSAGTDTVLGGAGSATVSVSGANATEAFALGGSLQFAAGTGASTVVAGTAGATLFGGASGGSLMFTDGATRYWGSGATDTVVGLNGSMTVLGGTGGGLFFGGTAGNNLITAGTGQVTAFGGGAGDQLVASGSAGDLFAAGAGAETLTGLASSGANTFFAGFGPDELVGGSGSTALVAGVGNDLLVGGSGVTLFLFVAGQTAGGSDTISGWDPTHDFVKLAGYATQEAQVVAGASVSNGSAVLTLSDGTHITFAGVTSLQSSSFT